MRMRLLGLLILGAAMPLVVEGQGAPPGAPPAAPPPQRPVRRTLDIRAQAPAPEVVTIRPREIPQFSRTLLIPVVYPPPGGATADSTDISRRTMIIFPGTLPVSGAARPAGASVTPPPSDSASRNRP